MNTISNIQKRVILIIYLMDIIFLLNFWIVFYNKWIPLIINRWMSIFWNIFRYQCSEICVTIFFRESWIKREFIWIRRSRDQEYSDISVNFLMLKSLYSIIIVMIEDLREYSLFRIKNQILSSYCILMKFSIHWESASRM